MLLGRARRVGVAIAIAITLPASLAAAEPKPTREAHVVGVVPEMARRMAAPCAQPACDAATSTDEPFRPVDLRIHLGEVAVATMEGVWLRRGPTLRNVPIMVSPIVIGDGVTLALGGRF